MKTEMQERSRLSLELPQDLHRSFKAKAAQEGVTMASLVQDWIANWTRNGTPQHN